MDASTPRHRLALVAFGAVIGVLIGITVRPLFEHPKSAIEPDLRTFAEVVNEVRDNYVEAKTSDALITDGIHGVMSSLDEHSVFLDAGALTKLTEQTTGHFGGVGIELAFDAGTFKVIAPVDDTPAQRAGIYPGDELIRIDDTPLLGRTLDQVNDALRGKRGTEVRVTVHRDNDDLEFTLHRAEINVASVRTRYLEPDYGYARISQFQTGTGAEFVKALKALQTGHGSHLKGLVLDLRNNPGGVLQASVIVADAFLTRADGLIVYTHGRTRSSDLRFVATDGDLLDGAPLIVLVNKGSASASEIVAGALQDHKRALILGSRSFGKGSVQAVLPLDHDRALKLTTALYYTPNGRSIQSKGIDPDVVIDADSTRHADRAALLAEALRQLKLAQHG